MSMCNPIVFLDSGVGGLPYLKQVREILPRESYVYVADNAEFPYGEKQAEEVRSGCFWKKIWLGGLRRTDQIIMSAYKIFSISSGELSSFILVVR